ncbi:MAG TPA: MaoC/PaaZ C-terminal domain-containing protein [Bryobacteraceae bacterium]|jgi:acyl dehydratase
MPTHSYFEDFLPGDLSTTPGRTITEADIINFAGLTGDWYELHTNVEYAAKTRFGQRIAHGALIFSISTALNVRAMPPGNTLIAFYGVDKLRFVKPTFIGDTIYCRNQVLEKQEKNESSGVVAALCEVVNQRGEIVISYTSRALWQRRPAS